MSETRPIASPRGAAARRIITPESFHVAPGLLGLRLASPGRRAAAISFDLVLVTLLASLLPARRASNLSPVEALRMG